MTCIASPAASWPETSACTAVKKTGDETDKRLKNLTDEKSHL